uniref:Small EDRK-rich factor-like N-terminal domain-containing protein n=1 Tax=Romanomermis culicivorax TaxID=13658 RepID=A0A915HXK3_ROMCU
MARGQQKLQSQQKNLKKQQDLKKQQNHDQKSAASKALVFQCSVCKTQMPDPKTYRQHFENKHPKLPLPADLQDAPTTSS